MTPQRETAGAGDPTAGGDFQSAMKVAAAHAAEVDRDARFPREAMDALRAAGALGWGVPREFGGAGAGIAELTEATRRLSERCSSTGMIFAMHQIQVACIARHREKSTWFAEYLETLVREQRLIASATSEVGIGGDVRRSNAALEAGTNGSASLLRFEKKASTISYGAHTDDLLTTLRRNASAEPSDQVLVLTQRADSEIEAAGEWDTLGMRGTCSPGFVVRAKLHPDQVLPDPFAAISAETMVPYSHILWSHVWLGIATDSFHRAQEFVREQARKTPSVVPPAALRLSELSIRMAEFRGLVQAAVKEHCAIEESGTRSALSTVGHSIRLNNLKIAASEAAVEICQGALRVCGLAGYKNTGPFSIGRQLRDAHSAALMIANDRLHATNAALLTVHREGT
jgi:acyl-CoA dehydrogenase